jgi:hypothetical protein
MLAETRGRVAAALDLSMAQLEKLRAHLVQHLRTGNNRSGAIYFLPNIPDLGVYR